MSEMVLQYVGHTFPPPPPIPPPPLRMYPIPMPPPPNTSGYPFWIMDTTDIWDRLLATGNAIRNAFDNELQSMCNANPTGRCCLAGTHGYNAAATALQAAQYAVEDAQAALAAMITVWMETPEYPTYSIPGLLDLMQAWHTAIANYELALQDATMLRQQLLGCVEAKLVPKSLEAPPVES